MKLVVLGATGPSGQCVVNQALDAGHDVTAVVRNPDRMTITHDKLKVVVGDIFSESSLQEHFTGHDAVLSCLGATTKKAAKSLYSDSMKCIVGGMRAANVTRVICMSTWCCTDAKGPFVVDWLLKPMFLKKVIENMAVMEAYLNECEDINYTVVKPPMLGDGNITAKEIKTVEGQYIKGVNFMGYSKIPRADVARFMLSCLDNDTWNRKLVSIA
ncbi:flavin reductase (NADPH)-like [Amphiura filiformis]|uniref:flavin reductase (NADPH)-like n=1 Tax=Amphiura filiformis TaxID=82378 RepID=UPI003B225865